MQFQIKARDDATARRVEQVLQYYLTGLGEQVDQFELVVEPTRDSLDTPLHRCVVHATLYQGGTLALEETQADILLAVNRLLDRSVRTLRRRGLSQQAARSA